MGRITIKRESKAVYYGVSLTLPSDSWHDPVLGRRSPRAASGASLKQEIKALSQCRLALDGPSLYVWLTSAVKDGKAARRLLQPILERHGRTERDIRELVEEWRIEFEFQDNLFDLGGDEPYKLGKVLQAMRRQGVTSAGPVQGRAHAGRYFEVTTAGRPSQQLLAAIRAAITNF